MAVSADLSLRLEGSLEFSVQSFYEMSPAVLCKFVSLRGELGSRELVKLFQSVELVGMRAEIVCPPLAEGWICFGLVPEDGGVLPRPTTEAELRPATDHIMLGGLGSYRYLSATEPSVHVCNFSRSHGFGTELKAPKVGPDTPIFGVVAKGTTATNTVQVNIQFQLIGRGVVPKHRPLLFTPPPPLES